MANKLLYGDNLEIMRKMPDQSIDLIYLDPPFNSNKNYNFLYSQATGLPLPEEAEAFCDAWKLDVAKEEKIREMGSELLSRGAGREFVEFWQNWIDALQKTNSKLLAYMVFMTERLVEMKRLLNPTGSIYLHCDPTASHYIKVIMDGIFGHDNFRNEIIWKRTSAHNDAKRWGAIHDIILFYSRSSRYYWHRVYTSYDKNYLNNFYKYEDEKGIYRLDNITNTRPGKYNYGYKGYAPHANGWRCPTETMQKWDNDGLIHFPKNKEGRLALKRYLNLEKGVPVQDIIIDIKPLQGKAKETLGYPTQKPLALLDRIIKASCPANGVVFDPFCGCGTTVIAAEQNKRQWIGADICMLAINSVEARLKSLFAQLQRGKDYRLDGLPTTLEQAITLANSSNVTKNEGRYQFQYWAIEKIGGFASTKKSGDGGVDGSIYFYKDTECKSLGKMFISVKSDKIAKIDHIRELCGVVANNQVDMGGLLCLYEPTEGMKIEALKAGFYDVDYGAIGKQSFPRVQILTVKDILESNGRFQTPFMTIKKKVAEFTSNHPSTENLSFNFHNKF